jgi:hypothetical protein
MKKFTDVSEVLAASIMQAASASEISLNFYYQTTQCNIPEYSHLYTYHCQNLKNQP